jgi:histidyl-tRNA synthetase
MKTSIAAVRGTREFYPEDMRLRAWLYRTIQRVAMSFGYQEYDAPFLERIELYAAKSGEELVKKQAFVFPDRDGNLVTLRPELTPSLARMVAQRQNQLMFPLRWWSFGPMWRYERPQKGRTREFFQWNADLVGAASPEGDAELVALAVTFLKAVGFQPHEVQILVNNRHLVEQTLCTLDIIPEQHPAIFRLIDRRDKLSDDAWADYAQELGIGSRQLDGIVSMLTNEDLWQQSDELQRFFAAIEAFGVQAYVRFGPHIVRGLDYYTGTVFEAWDQVGDFRALLGGGRYDNLVADVGGDPLPGVGFAMGDVVLTLMLRELGHIPQPAMLSSVPILITIFDNASVPSTLQLATELRQEGIQVACYPHSEKLRKQLKYADRIGAPLALIYGPDERAQNVVMVKDLCTHKQHTVARGNLVQTIRELLQ